MSPYTRIKTRISARTELIGALVGRARSAMLIAARDAGCRAAAPCVLGVDALLTRFAGRVRAN